MKKIAGLLIIAIGSRLTAQEVTDKFVPVTQKDLNTPDPADWLMLGGNMEHWSLFGPGNCPPPEAGPELRQSYTTG